MDQAAGSGSPGESRFYTAFRCGICDYLRDENRGIYSLSNSAVQHLGLVAGENSTFSTADFGLAFTDHCWENAAAIQSVIVQGCQTEFNKAERRHYAAVADLQKKLDQMRAELALFESSFALWQRKEDPHLRPGVSLRQRLRSHLARFAFRLLRSTQRKAPQAAK